MLSCALLFDNGCFIILNKHGQQKPEAMAAHRLFDVLTFTMDLARLG